MKIVKTFIGKNNFEFNLVEYDPSLQDDLVDFCERCNREGYNNNSSLKALKLGKWGNLEKWWVVYHKDKIISMSGAHYFPHLHSNCFIILSRMATMKAYNGMASSSVSARKMQHNFAFGVFMPVQIDWCLEMGATDIIGTTNSPENDTDNSGTMFKVHEYANKFFKIGYKATRIHKDFPSYNMKQDIWRFNVRDFATMEKIEYK